MRRLAVFAGSFSFGVFLAQYLLPHIWLLPLAGVCLLFGCGALLLPDGWRRRGVLIFTALSLALGWNWLYVRQVQQPMEALVETQQTVTMTLTDYAVPTDYGAKATVRIEGLPAKVNYYGDAVLLGLRPGETVTDDVYFRSAARVRETDLTTFTSKGIFLLGYSRGKPETGRGDPEVLRWLPKRLCRAMQQEISELFEDDTAAFLTALLTGDRSGLSPQAANDLSEAGLYHITAVSGMHCGFLLAMCVLLLGRHRKRLVALCSIPVLVFYALLTGANPSVVRACVMLSLFLAAPLLRRESDGPTSLLTALFLILLQNPFAIASVGLQLSFTAMAGILWLTPRLYHWLTWDRNRGKVYTFVAASLSASLGALAFSTPLSVYYFGILCLISPLSNLLCLSAVSAVFMLGLASVALGLIWHAPAALLAFLPQLLTKYILWMAHLLAKIPYHAVYTANPYLWYWLVFFYLLLAIAYFGKGKRRWPLAFSCAVLSLAVTMALGTYRRDGLLAVMLNVGQGQSIVLAGETACALVDCGSANSFFYAGDIAADELLTMGYPALDYLILTHYDADHVGGVEDLLCRMEVKTLFVPPDGEDATRQQVLRAAEEHGTAVQIIETAQTLSLGGADVTVYPPVGGKQYDNDQGLSVLASSGTWDFLITGDMETATEKHLLEAYDLPDLEVFAAGHHGSKYSTGKVLLDALTPETVIISAGDNDYGHPSEEVLRRLAERNCTVYRTDLHGSIHLFPKQGD